MSASGGVLIVVGVWILCQVLGGDALGRLGVTGSGTKPGTTEATPPGPTIIAPGPMTGVPVPGLN